MSIWDIGKPNVAVEKRKLKPRKREKRVKPIKPKQDANQTPMAKEVSRILRDAPLRFPNSWWGI